MAEMTKDEKVNKEKEIEDIRKEVCEENICLCWKRKEPTDDYNDLVALKKVAGWIKDSKKLELEQLDVRDEILKVVYDNCSIINPEKESHKEFVEKYIEKVKDKEEEDKNILLIKTAFGKKYAKQLNYDYDASLISSYIFCKTIDIPEPGKWKIEQISDNDNCVLYEYKISKGNDNSSFRGDTMNSWSRTINEYMRRFGDKYIIDYNGRKIPQNYKSWENYLSEPKHYKDKEAVPDYINSFMDVVYTIGNFALVPGPGGPLNFNNGRNSRFSDYWDLTLLEIYEYYMGRCEHNWICSLEKEAEAKNVIKNWLSKSEELKDQEGWNKFVKANYMQPFVEKLEGNNFGRPYELWDRHFTGNKKDVPKEEWQFEQFFERATRWIKKRSKLIAEALVNAKK